MWEIHDDNWKSKSHREKDSDVDININVSVDKDGDTCFNKIDRSIGAAAGAEIALNLCDVARGIRDVQSTIGEASKCDFGVVRNERDEHEGWFDGGRDEGHGHYAGGRKGDDIDFDPRRKRDEEPSFIDCEWGRLLEANTKEMLHKYAKIGASLKGSAG